jgi:hypothetical protein
MLRHEFVGALFDRTSRFDFITADQLSELAADDIYGYGDFCWADFDSGARLAELGNDAIAELTFFAHTGRPFRGVEIPALGNRLLYWSHDDGWYTTIFYKDWEVIARSLRRLLRAMLYEDLANRTLEALRDHDAAFWCVAGAAHPCEGHDDINALQQRYWRR